MRSSRLDRNLVLGGLAVLVVIGLASSQRRYRANGESGIGPTVVATLVSPFEALFTGTGRRISGAWGVVREIRHLYTENQQLRARVDTLTQQVNGLDAAARENMRLREMLRFREILPQRGQHTRAASVIGLKPTNWFNSIIIDAGSAEGLREKQMVITPRGLVGQVRLVTPHSSTVLLISDLNSGVGAQIQRTGWNGVVQGTAGPLLQMVFLPREADVRQGDLVVTNGMGSVFQVPGIVIGTVESVHLDENTSVKTAIVRPALDFRRLEEVLVITG